MTEEKINDKNDTCVTTYEQLKTKIDQNIKKYHAEMITLSDNIADNPELPGQEFETSKKVVSLLRRHGYDVEYPFAGSKSAFRGVFGNNDHKHKIAILAEYDALPELGHACGHCLSCASSVLAALSMKDLQDDLNADIHIIGTPDEEHKGYKCVMCNRGVFDKYDMAIMVHMYNSNWIMPKFKALDEFIYEFEGKSAHASAAPWEGRNALNGVQLMMHAVDMLRQHTKPEAQFHGIVSYGGAAPNIVPEKSALQLYIRADGKEYLEELIRLVDDCARGAAIATQTTFKRIPQKYHYYLNLRDNKTGAEALREVFDELGLVENYPEGAIFASSDIGNVSYVCPAFQPCLQMVSKAPIHTREFEHSVKTDRAHVSIRDAACIISWQIAKIFSDEEKIAAMKEDFTRQSHTDTENKL